jgi:hypothetical protein
MDDLQILGSGSRRSLMRSARTGAALFGTGFVAGIVVGIVFHALIYAAVIIAAVVIVLVALARLLIGRRRD